ncbi:hypothetical protein [Halobacteriovorax sp. CON-3]|uniref:hypothetical protein n=1 Tax=Halobacteriovorax sp. CON-3 TaxID=3157710 RepID=UPI00371792FE
MNAVKIKVVLAHINGSSLRLSWEQDLEVDVLYQIHKENGFSFDYLDQDMSSQTTFSSDTLNISRRDLDASVRDKIGSLRPLPLSIVNIVELEKFSDYVLRKKNHE